MLTGVAKNYKKRMLTYEQLSDLFRRLDRDGNGELDLEEFLQISSKLKLNASEDYISRWDREEEEDREIKTHSLC